MYFFTVLIVGFRGIVQPTGNDSMLVNYQMSEGWLPPASDQDNPVLVHAPGGVPQCPPPLLGILLILPVTVLQF